MFRRNRSLLPCIRSPLSTRRNTFLLFVLLNLMFIIYLISTSAQFGPDAGDNMQFIARKDLEADQISGERGVHRGGVKRLRSPLPRQHLVRPGKLNIRNQPWSMMNDSLREHMERVQHVVFGRPGHPPGDPGDSDPTGGCHSLGAPMEDLGQGPSWHAVTPGSRDHIVLSAYLDTRTSPWTVKVIGFSAASAKNLFCQIWYKGRPRPYVSTVRHQIIPETHGYRYGASFFTCATSLSALPYAVAVSASKCGRPSHHLAVSAPQRQTRQHRFTVCVSSPLNFHYDDVYNLVEYVELSRLLGADRVVLYNHTSGTAVDGYLRSYVSEGLLDVIPWRIPLAVHVKPPDPRVQPEVHYFGQVAALNDCLYRYMYKSEYIVFTDLDEFIVPRQHDDWAGMLGSIAPGHGYGAYMFRNAFFRIDWEDDSVYVHDSDRQLGLRTQLKLTREVRVWDYYSRTKYIVVPPTALVVGIHFVFEFVERSEQHLQVPVVAGMLHHYRDWGDEEGRPPRVLDPHMLKYGHRLRAAVTHRHRASNRSHAVSW